MICISIGKMNINIEIRISNSHLIRLHPYWPGKQFLPSIRSIITNKGKIINLDIAQIQRIIQYVRYIQKEDKKHNRRQYQKKDQDVSMLTLHARSTFLLKVCRTNSQIGLENFIFMMVG